jgi:uncharacterized protein (TIGR03435 family)
MNHRRIQKGSSNMRVLAGATLIVFTTYGAFCQSEGKLEFEVASIKLAPPPTGNNLRVMMGGDPGRLNFANVSLKDLIRQAYEVKDYQITGPDWLNATRYDVVAKLPPNTTKEQVPLMLQSLLADRFKLTLHRDKKELPVYVLVVGKNGPKLKKSEEDSGGPAPAGPPGLFGGRGRVQMGRGRLTAKNSTVSGFADILSRQLDRPVVDGTGIQGLYDFTLEWTPDERQNMRPGGVVPMREAGEEAHAGPAPNAPEPGAHPTIFAAVQEQFGLKMEAKKNPVEILVIDHAEKAPTEN